MSLQKGVNQKNEMVLLSIEQIFKNKINEEICFPNNTIHFRFNQFNVKVKFLWDNCKFT